MDIYVGIDGTGPSDDKQYQREFTNSFVNQLQNYGWDRKNYTRGPTALGFTTPVYANEMMKWLSGQLRSSTKTRLFIAGYSRGGIAAIELCRLLAKQSVTVHCLLLFDAVDMTTTLEADTVPQNVKTCFHAMRNPSSLSRSSWRNCGTRPEDAKATRYVCAKFLCTHGGMGGVPWTEAGLGGRINEAEKFHPAMMMSPVTAAAYMNHYILSTTTITPQQDRMASGQVRAWMFKNLAACRGGIPDQRPMTHGAPKYVG